jgi:RNA polymerase sigma-70 factor (sigma-E family)
VPGVRDQGSFAQFVDARRGSLLKFAMVLTGDYWLTEEIVADVLGRAFEQWERIEAMAQLHAYVRRMLVNEHISWRRRWARTRPTDPAQLPVTPTALADDDCADPIEIAARLTALTARQRAIVVLRYFEGLTDPEIAEVIGCRATTVRSHASRALQRLRLDLHPELKITIPETASTQEPTT